MANLTAKLRVRIGKESVIGICNLTHRTPVSHCNVLLNCQIVLHLTVRKWVCKTLRGRDCDDYDDDNWFQFSSFHFSYSCAW